MRIVVGVIALLLAGCADDGSASGPAYCGDGRPDIGEECDPGPGGANEHCTAQCTLPYADVTAHWSFESLNGESKSPCLPGDPEVKLDVISDGFPGSFHQSTPCSNGQLSFRLKHGLYSTVVTSVADHEYTGGASSTRVNGPTDLPTVVVYTDAGSVLVRVDVYKADGTALSRKHVGLTRLRLVVDNTTPVVSDECESLGVDAVHSGYLIAGTHSVRVEGLDDNGNVVAMSSTVDVDVVAGTNVQTTLELHLPMP